MAIANLSGAGTPLSLIKHDDDGNVIGEVTLTATSLTDRDIDHLDEWLKVQYLKAVRRSLREEEDITEIERDREMAQAHKTAAGLTWMSGEGAAQMASPRGLAKLLHTHCKDCTETVEELRTLLFHPENIHRVNEIVASLNISDFKSARLEALKAKAEARPGKHKRRNKGKKRRKKRK